MQISSEFAASSRCAESHVARPFPAISRLLITTLACALLLLGATSARAQVHDNASIFSRDAIEEATKTIDQMTTRHRHTLLVETFPAIPDSMQDDFRSKGKERFFQDWAAERGKAEGASGVVVLICMDPKHLQIDVGNETERKLFTQADRAELQQHLTPALHDKRYDDALTKTANFVLKKYDEHDPPDTGATNSAVGPSPGYTPPAYNPPVFSHPSYTSIPRASDCGTGGIQTFFCLFVGVIIVIALLRMVFRNSGGGYGGGFGGGGYTGGGYGGGGNYPPPGYGPGNVGGYGPGYAPPSRGSGFGSGLLGGLLGGAVGGYAADRLMHRDEGGTSVPGGGGYTAPPPDAGGSFTPDTSFSGGGSDFGSSSDSGSSSGADFGSSDSGGGGGSDFGGGGGGDSGGGSGGSDF
jgi:uncharacterized membrane protein YgcG